jgi:anti-anti-sigma factor
MEATVEQVGSVPVIAISGRLDAASAPVFDTQFADLLKTPHARMLVDLSQTAYISSAGLRSILLLVKHTAASGGRLGLFGASPQIHEVIEISGFPSLLDVYADRDAALAAAS